MPGETQARKLNIGDVLHIAQIGVLVWTLAVGWAKMNDAVSAVQSHSQKIDRIEHYLSSKDPQYWKLSKDD